MIKAWMNGSAALMAGAVAGGCRAFYGYPITPANEILELALRLLPRAGGLAFQAESELAAISMLYGAGAVGVPAMTASSGPGLSLMQEGLSYLAAARLPAVIVNVMRAGPGLGNIGPEQGDLSMALAGGHGDYHIPVFAPAHPQECYDIMTQAFELAFQERSPILILLDARVAQVSTEVQISRDSLRAEDLTLSPEAWPYQWLSNPDSFGQVVSTVELDNWTLEQKNDKRFEAYRSMSERLARAQVFPDAAVEVLVVAYGSVALVVEEAVLSLRAEGFNVGFFRPISLWPWPEKAFRACLGSLRHLLCVELSRGQLLREIERYIADCPRSLLYRDGGVALSLSEILQTLRQIFKNLGR